MNGQTPIVSIIGMPGSGKSTLTQAIAEMHGWDRLSTGDIIREEIARGTPLGLRLRDRIHAGELADTDDIRAIVEIGIASSDRPVVFDGFPRYAEEAEFIHDIAAEHGRFVAGAVYLVTSPETALRRIAGRMGSSTIVRPEDRSDVARHRIEIFEANIEPIAKVFSGRSTLTVVANQPPEEIIRQGFLALGMVSLEPWLVDESGYQMAGMRP